MRFALELNPVVRRESRVRRRGDRVFLLLMLHTIGLLVVAVSAYFKSSVSGTDLLHSL